MLVQILFYGFSLLLIAAALGVIVTRNPVHSALCLVVAFFTSAALWLLIEAEFLAIVLVLVYVGAVMVLFLFVVIAQIVGVYWFKGLGIDATVGAARLPEGYSNTRALGEVLYTQYVYPFELAAVLLLVAIVAAIALTMRRRPGLKAQDVAKQVAVRREDRVRLVKMPAERRDEGSAP